MTAAAEMLELLGDFLAEAGELLDGVELKLVQLEQQPDDKALLNEIFRGFHTIKGGAGFLEAAPLVAICHRTESLFDQLRSGARTLSPELLDAILAATAAVRVMFDEMATQGQPEAADPALLDTLSAWLDGAPAAAPATPVPAAVAAVPAAAAAGVDWDALHAVVAGRPVAPKPALALVPAAAPAAPRKAKPEAKENVLRIEVGRFDQILNLSGELGLTKNRLSRLRGELMTGQSTEATLKQLDRVVNQLSTLVGDLQNSVMKARMQPVGRVFQKYVRVARDLARQLGKEVELELCGEDTEIDKTILEEINDPLVHLVRNAVDHGVDTPAERVAAGKPPKSVVRLSARQVGDEIQIEIVDDGRGMRPDVLRQKAIEKGLLTPEEAGALDDHASLNLIFMPGFSTKAEVSAVSGRGVGMDVVRTNIRRLNGRIDLTSEPGRGTRVVIALPLTLAILPVLMFRLERQTYALPLTLIREIVRLDPARMSLVSGQASLPMRGEVLPVLRLADLLQRSSDGGGGEVGIVLQHGAHSLVLAVDSFVGQDEVVIKALEGFKPRGVAGATLSSDGALVLVLDMTELLHGRLLRAA